MPSCAAAACGRLLPRVVALLQVALRVSAAAHCTAAMPPVGKGVVLRRADGVVITHDPFAPGMAAKYGAPGRTDSDGFNPYADSVGAGIYSGTVERDANGRVVIGRQYQGHNPRPGPVYSGGGYTPVSTAIAAFRAEEAKMSDPEASGLARLLTEYPDLVNDVSTGGALPLHTCGMSRDNQHATAFIIARGGDIEALDTYGYTPLHRMASNNLAVGARALLEAGADPNGLTKTKVAGASRRAETPLNVALQSDARDVVAVLREFGSFRQQNAATAVSSVNVLAAGYAAVIGRYVARDAAEVPSGFAAVCRDNAWPVEDTWRRLNGGEEGRWYAHESNDSYIYFNAGDSMWWIDGPDGLGAYKAPGPSWTPPCSQIVWQSLRDSATGPGPTLSVVREEA